MVAHVVSLVARNGWEEGDAPVVLVLTFSRAGVAAFRQRLAAVAGPAAGAVEVRTYHSLSLRILRSVGQVGSLRDRLLSESRQGSLVWELTGPPSARCPEAIGPVQLEASPEEVLARIERVRCTGEDPEASSEMPPVERALARAYRLAKRRRRLVDHTDLVVEALGALRSLPQDRLRPLLPRHVVVDEAQDTNSLQRELVERVSAGAESVLVVGDPNQAIYGFQGADSAVMTSMRVLGLETVRYGMPTSYRCAQMVGLAADATLDRGRVAHERMRCANQERGVVGVVTHRSVIDEGAWLAREVEELQRHGLSVLVVARTNADLDVPSEHLRARGVPFERQGDSWLNHPVVSGLLDAARLACDPRDMQAACRLLDWPPERNGDYSARIRRVLQAGGPPKGYEALVDEEPERSEVLLVPALCASGRTSPARLYDPIVEAKPWELFCDPRRAEGARRLTERFVECAKLYRSVSELLEATARLSSSEKTASVLLSTAHGAKGLEADVAIVVRAEQARWPHQKAVTERERAEERRLWYVAVSRARTGVFLSWCQFSGAGSSRAMPRNPSPYLMELLDEGVALEMNGASLLDWVVSAKQPVPDAPVIAEGLVPTGEGALA